MNTFTTSKPQQPASKRRWKRPYSPYASWTQSLRIPSATIRSSWRRGKALVMWNGRGRSPRRPRQQRRVLHLLKREAQRPLTPLLSRGGVARSAGVVLVNGLIVLISTVPCCSPPHKESLACD